MNQSKAPQKPKNTPKNKRNFSVYIVLSPIVTPN
jgi:hypothetical protein